MGLVDRKLVEVPPLPGLGGGAVCKPRDSTSEGVFGTPKLGWDSSTPWLGVPSRNHGDRPLRMYWVDRNLAGVPPMPG